MDNEALRKGREQRQSELQAALRWYFHSGGRVENAVEIVHAAWLDSAPGRCSGLGACSSDADAAEST